MNNGDIILGIDQEGNRIELTPGNGGRNCLGNGKHFDRDSEPVEICCDECDYLICCTNWDRACDKCYFENRSCRLGVRTAKKRGGKA